MYTCKSMFLSVISLCKFYSFTDKTIWWVLPNSFVNDSYKLLANLFGDNHQKVLSRKSKIFMLKSLTKMHLQVYKYYIDYIDHFSGQLCWSGVLNKDPALWLDGARSLSKYVCKFCCSVIYHWYTIQRQNYPLVEMGQMFCMVKRIPTFYLIKPL